MNHSSSTRRDIPPVTKATTLRKLATDKVIDESVVTALEQRGIQTIGELQRRMSNDSDKKPSERLDLNEIIDHALPGRPLLGSTNFLALRRLTSLTHLQLSARSNRPRSNRPSREATE